MRAVRSVGGVVIAVFASTVAGLPFTVVSLSLLAFQRWRILPLQRVVKDIASSAGWYWMALLPAAGLALAFRLSPGLAAVAGAALAALASVPCVAGLTGRTVAEVARAASARRIDFAIIAGSSAIGGAVAGALAPLIVRLFRRSA